MTGRSSLVATGRTRLLLLAGALSVCIASGCRPDTSPPQPQTHADSLAALGVAAGRIAFVAERDGNPETYVLDLHTGQETRLTRRDEGDYPMAAVPGTGDVLIVSATPDGPEHRESLWRYEAAADTLRPLNLSAGQLRHPVVSSDGAWLVVESDVASARDLFRYTFATDRFERLTDHALGNYDPNLSPDGQKMVFASSRERQAELYVMPLGEGGRDALLRLTAMQADDFAPRWSPDGAWIAFQSLREGPARLFLVKPDGTDMRRLLAESDTLAATSNEGEAVWSPDGRRVAFEVLPSGGGAQVWVAEAQTGRRWRVAAPLFSASQPSWSPDGRALVVAGMPTPSGNADLYAADADGKHLVRLTTAATADWLPRWLAR